MHTSTPSHIPPLFYCHWRNSRLWRCAVRSICTVAMPNTFIGYTRAPPRHQAPAHNLNSFPPMLQSPIWNYLAQAAHPPHPTNMIHNERTKFDTRGKSGIPKAHFDDIVWMSCFRGWCGKNSVWCEWTGWWVRGGDMLDIVDVYRVFGIYAIHPIPTTDIIYTYDTGPSKRIA